MGMLLIPFVLVRFVLMALLDRTALARAAHFAPVQGRERVAYWVFQGMSLLLLVLLLLLPIQTRPQPVFVLGALLYAAGLALLAASVAAYARPSGSGLNQNGVYRLSRNPMYVAYFVLFYGSVLLTQSVLLFAATVAFQLSAHSIIRSEERWCLARFGQAYLDYMQKVRRYF